MQQIEFIFLHFLLICCILLEFYSLTHDARKHITQIHNHTLFNINQHTWYTVPQFTQEYTQTQQVGKCMHKITIMAN
jgi:hypothetical protein